MTAVLLCCVAGWYLTGLSWTVALVTYPGFKFGGSAEWTQAHRFHSRRIAIAVGPVWAVEAIACGFWLLRPPHDTIRLGILASIAAALTVLITVIWAVPTHNQLSDNYSESASRRLRLAHAARTLAWTVSAVSSTVAISLLMD